MCEYEERCAELETMLAEMQEELEDLREDNLEYANQIDELYPEEMVVVSVDDRDMTEFLSHVDLDYLLQLIWGAQNRKMCWCHVKDNGHPHSYECVKMRNLFTFNPKYRGIEVHTH